MRFIEAARREFYIGPLLFTVLDQTKFRLSIEYKIPGTRLKGDLDYLLRGQNNVVVVEAKRADMERGFTQLSAEMIALADYLPNDTPFIHGAVTTGDLWRFGILDRQRRLITKDLDNYLLPRDL